MTPEPLHLATQSPEETRALAAAIAPLLRANDVLGLCGTLGAGKTCFVQGLALGLGVPAQTRVVSPTFVLMRRYEGRLMLYHFDGYRLHGAAEMEEIGCAETFASGGVSAVEWADHVAGCMPAEHFTLTFDVAGECARRLLLGATGPGPTGRLPAFAGALARWLA